MGDLITTDVGDSLMPLATGSARAWKGLERVSSDSVSECDQQRGFETLAGTSEYADSAKATAREQSLELELRTSDGSVIPTESISIQDTHYLLELAREIEDDVDFMLEGDDVSNPTASIDHDVALLDEWFEDEGPDLTDVSVGDEPWQESPYPRYQIQVQLIDDRSVP
jgi:hypothetical protein